MVDIYNLALFVESGFEDTCIKEFEKIVDKKLDFEIIKFRKLSVIVLKKLDFEEIIKISYVSRTIHDAIILLLFSEIDKIDHAFENIEIPFDFFKFKVKIVKDKGKYNNISKYLYKKLKKFSKREGSKLIFKGYLVEEKLIFGISLSESIGKRKYKTVNYEDSINPVSINTFLSSLDIVEKDILVVPIKDGTIPIEAGILLKNIPANFWSKKDFYIIQDLNYLYKLDEKFVRKTKAKIYAVDDFSRNILIAKRNALNATVKDIIFFKRANLSFLDLLIDKKFDFILVDLYKSKRDNIKDLLYSSKNALKDNGKIIIISDKELLNFLDPLLKKLNLKISDYRESIFFNKIKRFYILEKNNF